jgi:SLT domain-containing protein
MLRKTIDTAIRSAANFDEFLAYMQKAGYESKHGKHISFRAAGQERFTRAKTIGENYTEERIKERLKTEKSYLTPQKSEKLIRKMIDRNNEKIKSSGGYSQWASIHNIKVSAETLMYLKKHCNNDLAEFEKRYRECMDASHISKAALDRTAAQIETLSNKPATAENTAKLKRLRGLKAIQSEEYSALYAERFQLAKIKANINDMIGEKLYHKYSKTEKEVSL